MPFLSRHDAGQRLGRQLLKQGVDVDVVVGLPRGGVVVAAEVAHVLERPLEVLVVRKIGHPMHREFAIGALAEADVVLLDEQLIGLNQGARTRLAEVLREEKQRLQQYRLKFHQGEQYDFRDRNVLLVDDGLATGSTMEAAAMSARKLGANRIFVAVPVASTSAMERLQALAEDTFALIIDPEFEAVGAYYAAFSQTTDEEVMELLKGEHVKR